MLDTEYSVITSDVIKSFDCILVGVFSVVIEEQMLCLYFSYTCLWLAFGLIFLMMQNKIQLEKYVIFHHSE